MGSDSLNITAHIFYLRIRNIMGMSRKILPGMCSPNKLPSAGALRALGWGRGHVGGFQGPCTPGWVKWMCQPLPGPRDPPPREDPVQLASPPSQHAHARVPLLAGQWHRKSQRGQSPLCLVPGSSHQVLTRTESRVPARLSLQPLPHTAFAGSGQGWALRSVPEPRQWDQRGWVRA